jgi:hypothetical protein
VIREWEESESRVRGEWEDSEKRVRGERREKRRVKGEWEDSEKRVRGEKRRVRGQWEESERREEREEESERREEREEESERTVRREWEERGERRGEFLFTESKQAPGFPKASQNLLLKHTGWLGHSSLTGWGPLWGMLNYWSPGKCFVAPFVFTICVFKKLHRFTLPWCYIPKSAFWNYFTKITEFFCQFTLTLIHFALY